MLECVAAILDRADAPYAMIGAAAMATSGAPDAGRQAGLILGEHVSMIAAAFSRLSTTR